jgi:thiol-disulfide isomerase/thioredoxin/uncharacterized GH25 family protein
LAQVESPTVAWDDLQSHIDEALAALPEKYRLAIIYHFFEGQTHAEVARTLGITRSAVTKRIARGIDELRKDLRARGIGVASAGLAATLAANAVEAAPATLTTALAKLALSGSGAAATALSGSSLVSIVLGKWAIAGVVVATLAGGGVWYAARTIATPMEQTKASPPPAVAAAIIPPEKVQPAPQSTTDIVGIAVSPEGYPRADVGFGADFTANTFREPKSDIDGRVALPVEAAGKHWIGRSQNTARSALVKVPEAVSTEPLRIVLAYRTKSFIGRVVDASGNGVAGLKVDAEVETSTGDVFACGTYDVDVNGFCIVYDIATGDDLRLRVRVATDGGQAAGAWSDGVPLADRPHSLNLPPLTASDEVARIAREKSGGTDGKRNDRQPLADQYGGRILDTEGKPVDGAWVEVNYFVRSGMVSSVNAATDENGRWTTWLPADLNKIDLRVQHPECVPTVMDRSVVQPPMERLRDGTAELRLRRGLPVRGHIRGTDNRPVADALLLPHTRYSRTPGGPEPTANAPIEDDYSRRTAPDGAFELTGLPPGENSIQVSSRAYAPRVLPLDVTPGMEPIVVTLDSGETIRGRVVDADNMPLPGVAIVGDEWILDRQYELNIHEKTNENGEFVLNHVPLEGILRFGINGNKRGQPRRFLPMSTDIMIPREVPYTLVLYSPLVFQGTVSDEVTGKPVTSFRVKQGWLMPGERTIYWNRMADVKTIQNENGAFSVSQSGIHVSFPDSSVFSVSIEADGYLPARGGEWKLGEKNEPIAIKLKRGTPWTGRVTLPDGNVAEGAQVAWVGNEYKAFILNGQLDVNPMAQAEFIEDTTADGAFSLPPSGEAGYLVAVHPGGYAIQHSDKFRVGGDLRLVPWSTVKGALTSEGKPIPDALIQGEALPSDDDQPAPPVNWTISTTTHVDGSYEFSHLPAVPIRIGQMIVGDRHGEMSHTQCVTPKPGNVLTVDLGAERGSAEGKIDLPTPEAMTALRDAVEKKVLIAVVKRVDTVKDAPKSYEAQYVPEIRPDGSIRLDGIPSGRYELAIDVHAPSPAMRCGIGRALWSGKAAFAVPPGSSTPVRIPSVALHETPIPTVGAAAPELQAWTFDQKEFTLAKQKGKYVLIDFWAMWCAPCRNGSRELLKIWENYKSNDKVVFAGVSLDDDSAGALGFVTEQAIPWVQLKGEAWGPDNVITKDFGIASLPSIWLIAPDGTVLARDLDVAEAGKALEKAVASQ